MSDSSSFFPSGGKRRIQRFTTSGTFTPSAVHLARGGVTTITYSGGGGSGALNRLSGGSITPRASGGDAGQRIRRTVVLTGPVTHVIGAGGAALTASGTGTVQAPGFDGSDTTVTGLPTAKGGKGGLLSSANTVCRGGNGAGSPGMWGILSSSVVDARGGAGVDGSNGGGGGTPDTTVLTGSAYVFGASAQDGGGAGIAQAGLTAGAVVVGNSATPNSGAGGGATAAATAAGVDITASSGAGAAGWIEYEWEE